MRLTDTWTWKVVDETTAKMVVYEGRAMWAFGGPACMGDQPTAVWLASLLADNGPDEIGGAIGRSADSILRRYPEPARRLAVVAAGWQGSPEALVPPVSPDRQLRLRHGRALASDARHRGAARSATRQGEGVRGGRRAASIASRRDRGSRAPSSRPPERERRGYRGHPGRRIRHAGGETPARREARAHRIDPARWLRQWRDRPPTGEWTRVGGDDTNPGLWVSRELEPDWAGPVFIDSGVAHDAGVRYLPAYAAPGVATVSPAAYDPCGSLPRRPR